MKKILTGALAALTLGGAAVSTATPAAAQSWRHGGYHAGYGYRGGGWHRGGYGGGAVLGAGILGLAVGAAIAGNHPHYYAPAYPVYGYGYGYGPVCRSHLRWDPYYGRYVRVERCW